MDYSLEEFNWKFVAFFVAVSAVLVTGIYFIFPNQLKENIAPSRDWNIYTDEDYSIEFKYPDGMLAAKERDDQITIIDGRYGDNFIWTIDLYHNPRMDNLENWIQREFNGFKSPENKDCRTFKSGEYFNDGRADIGDNKAILVSDTSDFDQSCLVAGYYLMSPSRSLVVKFNLIQASAAFLKEIISTFKFTDSESDGSDNSTCDEFCIKSFSPDKKYTLLNSGTSPLRSFKIINNQTRKRVATFNSFINYIWLGDEFVFDEPVEFQDATMMRPWGGGEGTNISKIVLSTGEKIILLKADSTHDYSLARNSEGSIIKESDGLRIDANTYAPTGGYERFMNPSVQHWIMDSSGKLIKNIDN